MRRTGQFDGETAWHRYHRVSNRLRSSNPESATLAQMAAQGPPPPPTFDPVPPWLDWYTSQPPTPVVFSFLLVRLHFDGLLSSDEVDAYAGRATADSMAEIKATLQARAQIAAAHHAQGDS
ncbi:hypothetical protein [Nocardia bovistercoris]|uniref:Uncharacterized protein n=1 Tax=Nocardia bovistercoris TaxID=2785916 RepID=A0A931IF26_9NOCA|nr:hypothetical protein [Nocardia bovistercoris]MBH0780522.1 hypothetical protein [Nocardia bovistercoris]